LDDDLPRHGIAVSLNRAIAPIRSCPQRIAAMNTNRRAVNPAPMRGPPNTYPIL